MTAAVNHARRVRVRVRATRSALSPRPCVRMKWPYHHAQVHRAPGPMRVRGTAPSQTMRSTGAQAVSRGARDTASTLRIVQSFRPDIACPILCPGCCLSVAMFPASVEGAWRGGHCIFFIFSRTADGTDSYMCNCAPKRTTVVKHNQCLHVLS